MSGLTDKTAMLDPSGRNLSWIFGSSRSGSTWLLRMVSGLDGVVPIDDPHIGHHLGVWRPIPLAWATATEPPELRTLQQFKHEQRDYLLSDQYRDHWVRGVRDLIRARYEPQIADDMRLRGIDDPLVVVKEPAAHAADLLVEMFPASRLIFLLRDGRDVVDSWLDAYSDGAWAMQEGAYPLSDKGRIDFIRWQAEVWLARTKTMQEVFAAHDPARRVLLRYEEMREDPAGAVGAVCDLLGIEADEGRLHEIGQASAFEHVPSTEKGNGRFVRRAEPGGWRESMSAEEIAAMDEILGEKLVELGYATRSELTSPAVPMPRRQPAA
jgi:hypothetical protein